MTTYLLIHSNALSLMLIGMLVIILFQHFMASRSTSRLSKHHDERTDTIMTAIACLSSKIELQQLAQEQFRIEMRKQQQILHSEMDIIKTARQEVPSENEFIIHSHQSVVREIREVTKILKASGVQNKERPAKEPAPAPIIFISDEEEDDDDGEEVDDEEEALPAVPEALRPKMPLRRRRALGKAGCAESHVQDAGNSEATEAAAEVEKCQHDAGASEKTPEVPKTTIEVLPEAEKAQQDGEEAAEKTAEVVNTDDQEHSDSDFGLFAPSGYGEEY